MNQQPLVTQLSPAHPHPHLTWRDRALVAAVFFFTALAWWPGLATLAEQQVDAGLKRALVSFGVARAINALLSVLQGTEVSLHPIGVGLTLSLGQILEPVNRIVEQFSTVTLIASVAFGAERVLISIGSWWPVSAALSMIAFVWCWRTSSGRLRHRSLSHLLLVLLLLRFAVPFATIGSDLLFNQFLSASYARNLRALEQMRDDVQQATPSATQQEEPRSLKDRINDLVHAPVQAVRQRYDSIRAGAEGAIEHLVQLMVVFALQTILMPLFLLWALFRASRVVMDPNRPPHR